MSFLPKQYIQLKLKFSQIDQFCSLFVYYFIEFESRLCHVLITIAQAVVTIFVMVSFDLKDQTLTKLSF